MNPIRVLALIDTFRVGGPGKQLIAFCKAAPDYGLEVEIGTFLRPPRRSTPFTEGCREAGLAVRLFQERFPFDFRVSRSVRECLFREKFDLLQTHSYKANVIGALLSRPMKKKGIRWVAYMHGFTRENLKVRIYYALETLAIKRADAVVAVSHAIRRKLEARVGPFRVRSEVILNALLPEAPVESSVQGEAKRKIGFPAESIVLGVIGRLSREKGQQVFLDALARLDNPRVYALLAGEGPEEQELKRQAEAAGLQERVRFSGYHDDLDPIYAALDLVVIPSLSEGIPNVALEAMEKGLPLVASAVGGLPEMITDRENGLLIPAGDPAALAKGIDYLLAHREDAKEMARRGREVAAARFSMADRMKQIGGLYRNVIRVDRLPAGPN